MERDAGPHRMESKGGPNPVSWLDALSTSMELVRDHTEGKQQTCELVHKMYIKYTKGGLIYLGNCCFITLITDL